MPPPALTVVEAPPPPPAPPPPTAPRPAIPDTFEGRLSALRALLRAMRELDGVDGVLVTQAKFELTRKQTLTGDLE